jgi:hypothetical protein
MLATRSKGISVDAKLDLRGSRFDRFRDRVTSGTATSLRARSFHHDSKKVKGQVRHVTSPVLVWRAAVCSEGIQADGDDCIRQLGNPLLWDIETWSLILSAPGCWKTRRRIHEISERYDFEDAFL